MKDAIVDIVKSYWARRLPQLSALIAETSRQIDNILVLEDYHRTARTDEKLNKAVGMFGTESMDLGSLSAVLQQASGARGMQKERFGRIEAIARELLALRKSLADAPLAPAFVELQDGAQAVQERFEAHIAAGSKIFRLLRTARLEAKGQYDKATHDDFFARFNWRNFDAGEMVLCPPFVVLATMEGHWERHYGALLELLTSGKPLNVVLRHTTLDPGHVETGRAAALGSTTGIELMFIALRNVFFAQGSSADAQALDAMIERGLASQRPAVFSLYGGTAESDRALAEQALRARAFPHFVYDPDRAANFVACLDLSQNPEVEAGWVADKLEYLPPESKELEELERPYTFADFAVSDPAMARHFTPLDKADTHGESVGMAAYLELTPEVRRERTPVVHSVDAKRQLQVWVPSQSMLAQTADKAHLWRSLQELGGIHNPFVQQAERRMRDALTAEKEKALGDLQQDLDTRLQEREQEAVTAAMQRLALSLTGMAAMPTTAAAPAVQPTPATAPAVKAAPAAAVTPAEAVEVSATPWIDERLCTTCDDCITINKKLFAYNADKKAIIKDPRGGPYKDIVRAAEKCASDAIHPGLPLDPAEKDADKWIKRAEPYQ